MKKSELLKLEDAQLDKAVKIQGTMYDRKRKMNSLAVRNAASMLKSGKELKDVAEHFGVDARTILYNTDAEYKAAVLNKASGKHTGKTNKDLADRAEYKRQLLKSRKNVIVTE